MIENDNPITKGKGLKGQNCNVRMCQAPNSAHHYNIIMKAWYCRKCAIEIQRFCDTDEIVAFEEFKKVKE